MKIHGITIQQFRSNLVEMLKKEFPDVKENGKTRTTMVFCSVTVELNSDDDMNIRLYISVRRDFSDVFKFSSTSNNFEDLLVRLDFEINQAQKNYADSKLIIK